MQKKLTVTINEEVYEGLRRVIGPGKISRFIEDLVRPHVLKRDMYADRKRWLPTKSENPRHLNGWKPHSEI